MATTADALKGATVYSSEHEKVGDIDDVLIDAADEPRYVHVTSGWFGRKKHLIPVDGLQVADGEVVAPYSKEALENAPTYEGDTLDIDTEREVADYYGRSVPDASPGAAAGEPTERIEDEAALTRSEEELRIIRERGPQEGAVRLRRWVETESVAADVPVERETARVVREPVEGRERREGGIGEDEVEVRLHEEQVRAEKQTVDKERVRIEKGVETDERRVEADLRKERIDVEDDTR